MGSIRFGGRLTDLRNVVIGETESLCPICFRQIAARKETRGADVVMVKDCPAHGSFEVLLWRGAPEMASWNRPKEPVLPPVCYADVHRGCPYDCGLCSDHRQLPCSVVLEITHLCNLQCPVCFSDAGSRDLEDPDLEQIEFWYRQAYAVAGPCSIQLSGGEPTLRDDLPAIIRIGKQLGFSFIQLNTNGVRLASNSGYAQNLKDAGLTTVYLQFDGVDDNVYRTLRGKPLLGEKLLAIEHCGQAGLGVVLVPTLVPGVNTDAIGAIVKLGVNLAPVVRGIHFQPVSYFGRYPGAADHPRMTLPEVMRALEAQTEGNVRVSDFAPPGCEHSLCSFHSTYIRQANGRLKLITGKANDAYCSPRKSAGAGRTIDLVSKRWALQPLQKPQEDSDRGVEKQSGAGCNCGCTVPEKPLDLDTFLEAARNRSFTISAMAFQDAWNIDLERLKSCCISVVAPDGRLVPFCAYNMTSAQGESLYRKRCESV